MVMESVKPPRLISASEYGECQLSDSLCHIVDRPNSPPPPSNMGANRGHHWHELSPSDG